jgi:hypothetical protein
MEPQFELEELFENTTAHQPVCCIDEWLNFSTWEQDEKIKKDSFLLYPKNRDDEILNTALQPRCFEWNNFKRCYSNISVDLLSNRLEIRPILPWQLILDNTFEDFQKEYEKEMFVVARLGCEVCFGPVADLQDLDTKIRLWFNHHIYDTSILVDVHDFNEERERRIRTFVVRIAPNGEESKLMWRKSFLEDLKKI